MYIYISFLVFGQVHMQYISPEDNTHNANIFVGSEVKIYRAEPLTVVPSFKIEEGLIKDE